MTYNVYRRPQGADAWSLIAEGVEPPYEDGSAQEGETYEYTIARVVEGVEREKGHVTAGSLWLPTLLSGLQLWLRGDGTGMYTDQSGTDPSSENDEVERWEDQSGQGNDFITPGYSESPFLRNNGIDFDGDDDYMHEETKALGLTSAFTLGIRVGPEDETTLNPIFARWNEGENRRSFDLRLNADAVELRLSFDGLAETVVASGAGVIDANVYQTVVARYDGAASTASVYVGGAEVASTASAPSSLINVDHPVELARSMEGGVWSYFNGDWAKAVFYNRALTDAERSNVENYLEA
jgi:hypothetical protein